ncbi:EF-hand domain-containing protein [Tropicimonas marinistellae]|uniref:EF-hand domain-containing protein n=1 Tax=Tropicimonas marinistellae TaxID=1739787 RepID=UPI00082F7D2E|nr:EF-hand domain-containing protein [Tropicimonas marinistellae]
MTRIILLSTAIVSGLLVANDAIAFGGPKAPGERPTFSQLDTDGDGKVTPAEMQAFPAARAAERFKAADADGDGAISKEELTASIEQMRANRDIARAEAMLSRLDTDGDGTISQEEMTANPGRNRTMAPGERFFTWADTYKDGAISEAEFDAAANSMAQRADRFGRRDFGRDDRGKAGPRGDVAPFWRN